MSDKGEETCTEVLVDAGLDDLDAIREEIAIRIFFLTYFLRVIA
ncbi:MAG: hypothetical protein ACFFED_16435 [Candidatus Thorarchaeota archaeon]